MTEARYVWLGCALGVLYVLVFYSGGLDFISHRFGAAGATVSRALIVGYLALALLLLPVAIGNLAPLAVSGWAPVFVTYAAALGAVMCFHLIVTPQESGTASRSFLIALCHLGAFGLVLGTLPYRTVVHLTTAAVIVASCALILTEVRVTALAETAGRGSGLYLNPNVAALAVLLGSLAAIKSLPSVWRLPFLGLVGLATFATLSRSGIIAGALVGIAWFATEWKDIRRAPAMYWRGAVMALLVLAGGTLFLKFMTADEFSWAASSASGPLVAENIVPRPREIPAPQARSPSAPDPAARKPALAPPEPVLAPRGVVRDPATGQPPPGTSAPVRAPAEAKPQAPPRPPPAAQPAALNCDSWTVIFRGLREAQACPWLRLEYVDAVQKSSSGGARAVLALRSAAGYLDAPWIGIGLEQAFAFRAHNAFLFFGIAYGVLGLLFIPFFAAFAVYCLGGWRAALPLVVFLFSASFFSHDMFLSYALVAGLVIALSACPASRPKPATLDVSPRWAALRG